MADITACQERKDGMCLCYIMLLFSVSLQDINMRKPFKSSVIKEQQVITKSSRPQSVMLMYQHYCEPAPALHILNPYRCVMSMFHRFHLLCL